MGRTGQTGLGSFAEFIRHRQGQILDDWIEGVQHVPAARDLPRPVLIDAVSNLLMQIAHAADEIAGGHAGQLRHHAADQHALSRLDTNFDLPEVITEFAVLRSCIARVWDRDHTGPEATIGRTVLNQAIDEALTASVERFTQARNHTLDALDRVSAAALQAGNLDELLQELLHALLDTIEAVDAATILLRDGDDLVVRASVGLEEHASDAFRLPLGDGFAGRIAAENTPLLLTSAATHPLVRRQVIRDKGVKALYGIPLVDADRVIGVVHMGSLSAPDFSDQDKRLLTALASRATAAIVQHVLRQEVQTRARQQEAVAALGRRALASQVIADLLDDAVGVVSQTLGTEMAKVLEVRPDGRTLLLRAGVGWSEGLVGRATVSAGTDSQAGYTLLSDQAVIVEDLRRERRFSGPPLLHDHGVVSGMSVIIDTPRGATVWRAGRAYASAAHVHGR